MSEVLVSGRLVALVDDGDYQMVSGHSWSAVRPARTRAIYAHTRGNEGSLTKFMYMHRLIMGAPVGVEVDHINGDGLDNRRSNLRLCTRSQNQGNQGKLMGQGGAQPTSQYRGVTWNKAHRRWVAQIHSNRKNIFLGHFQCEVDAAKAYDHAAIEMWGEFARPNLSNYNKALEGI